MKEIYKLSEFERGDFYPFSNKIILNETIRQKDFSEYSMRQVDFSNCIFDCTSFPSTKCEDLTFESCIFQNVGFKDSELENFIFQNCQLIGTYFSGSDLMDFGFINCSFPASLINYQTNHELQVKLRIIQCMSTNSLEKVFHATDFLNQFNVSTQKQAHIKELIVLCMFCG
jgi:uncharacterized protein YjbI with pentapeptide repeats